MEKVECQVIEQKYSMLQQVAILAGALVAIGMAAMNQNMVAAALGGIVGEFRMGEVTWVAGSYLLAMTAFQPLYGKFSDIFGRSPTLIAAMFLFLVGSLGCGLAQGPLSLVAWRAVSGIGAGGLITLPFIIVSDMVELEKRSLYMGSIQIAYGVCSVVGPLLGGAFVDLLSWRWVFFFQAPLSVIGLVIVFLMPNSCPTSNLPISTKLARIDLGGTATLLAGTILVMFGLNVGGKDYAWPSTQVISSLGLGGFLLVLFLMVELKLASEPIVPFRMLNRNTLAVTGTAFCLGFSVSTAINYIPLYHQTAQARSFTLAGIHSIVFLLAISISAAASGMLIKQPKYHRILMWVGMAMVVLCNALGAFIRPDISQVEEVAYSLFIGLGVGLNIQVVVIMAQAFSLPQDMAIATSFIQYAGSMGQVLGLAIHSAIFNSALNKELLGYFPDRPDILLIVADSSVMRELLTSEELLSTQLAYQAAFRCLLLSLVPISALGLVSSLCIHSVPTDDQN